MMVKCRVNDRHQVSRLYNLAAKTKANPNTIRPTKFNEDYSFFRIGIQDSDELTYGLTANKSPMSKKSKKITLRQMINLLESVQHES